jgi:hypothetical protein
MKDSTLSRLGGTCSILVGVSYLVVGIAFVLQPAELAMGADAARFYPAFAQAPTLHLLFHLALALSALFGFGAVLAISEVMRPANEGWVCWTSLLAYLGFAATASATISAHSM